MFYNLSALFVSEPIEVMLDGDGRNPEEFIWRNRSVKIARVVSAWQDWGFAQGAHKPDWRQRRHRNCFLVESADNRLYEIYLDRSRTDQPAWFLFRILDNVEYN